MSDTTTIEGESTDAEVMLPESEVEPEVEDQIRSMVDHEAFTNDVAIMPDTHVGAGAVIGFTMPLGNRVVPNTIGVDIGCGMYAEEFGYMDLDDHDLAKIDEEIRNRVPMGFSVYDDNDYNLKEDFPWEAATMRLVQFEEQFGEKMQNTTVYEHGGYTIDYFKDLCERVGYDPTRAINSVGTLGGGNHFIELGEAVESGNLWCIIHSGSRGLGLHVAEHHQDRAEQLRTVTDVREHFADLGEEYTQYLKFDPDEVSAKDLLDWIQGGMGEDYVDFEALKADYKESNPERIGEIADALKEALTIVQEGESPLAYLDGEEAYQYFVDMIFAQMYASESRKRMMRQVEKVLGKSSYGQIESVHNFIDFRDLTIRKGATRANEGELAIIPFNMRDGTLIVRGKGNADWNHSAPHGAGRVMSRTQAYRDFDVEQFEAEMDGIYSSSVTEDTLDEAPMAYKNSALIEQAIGPTATIVDRIEPVLNIKAED